MTPDSLVALLRADAEPTFSELQGIADKDAAIEALKKYEREVFMGETSVGKKIEKIGTARWVTNWLVGLRGVER